MPKVINGSYWGEHELDKINLYMFDTKCTYDANDPFTITDFYTHHMQLRILCAN